MPAKKTGDSKKILLIDEKSDTPLFVSLQHEGYEVIACESPQKAWGLVYPTRPCFIIVHLHHPSRRDIDALQECRALAEGVPVLVATSLPGNEGVMKALEERATAFLSLPVKPDSMGRILTELEKSINERSTGLGVLDGKTT
jgi:DNA-binding NtrC family response regulator